MLIKRLINQWRCLWSYALSRVGIYYFRHLPAFVSVEPANFCQLHCPECPVGRAELITKQSAKKEYPAKKILDKQHFSAILEQVLPSAHTMQFFFQGEPLLNPELPEMIAMAHKAGLYTIVSTNAQALDKEVAESLIVSGISRIIVSMDGWTQASYEAYRRGGQVEKVKNAVAYLREAKTMYHSQAIIELQCLRLRTNEHEWDIFSKEYRRLGADRLVMKTAQLYDYEQGNALMTSDDRYSRYAYDPQRHRYILKRPMRNHCYRLWSGCVIDTVGNVLPCCYDKSGQHIFGNIHQADLADIWHGERANAFRWHVMRSRKTIAICTNCDE